MVSTDKFRCIKPQSNSLYQQSRKWSQRVGIHLIQMIFFESACLLSQLNLCSIKPVISFTLMRLIYLLWLEVKHAQPVLSDNISFNAIPIGVASQASIINKIAACALNFKSHIEYISHKVKQRTSVLWRMRNLLA